MALPWKYAVQVFVCFVLFALPSFAQISEQPTNSDPANTASTSGSIGGTVVDSTGALVAGAHIQLKQGAESLVRETTSASDGQFSFVNIAPGPFHLTITQNGFSPSVSDGELHAGELRVIPQITLTVASADTEVNVSKTRTEIAQEEIKDEEKQRVLKVIPNFYVTYLHNATPLDKKQKFELAWKTVADPISFALIGAVAGVQQSQNDFKGYGQGAAGYAKRYGASYGDFLSGTLIGAAILPSVLKQDPRYFYKGTGSKRSRVMYALANAVICKGDNGRWQPNYSSVLGNLAAGGLSNLYYPAEDRNGATLTFENTAIGIGTTGAFNLVEEFLVKKFSNPSAKQ